MPSPAREGRAFRGLAPKPSTPSLSRRLLAEALGTAALLAVVIGSGVMAERLAGGNAAVALLANTFATVFGLYALIEAMAPVSGAHFNPAVSIVLALRGELPVRALAPYIAAQLCGAIAGAWIAHAMFELPLLQASSRLRGGVGQWIAEAVATAGLVLVILRAPAGRAAAMVASYIGAAYWFTASTSFANPAAVAGRMASDTFAGIAPASAPAFVIAELAGAALGVALDRALNGQWPGAGPPNTIEACGRRGEGRGAVPPEGRQPRRGRSRRRAEGCERRHAVAPSAGRRPAAEGLPGRVLGPFSRRPVPAASAGGPMRRSPRRRAPRARAAPGPRSRA